MELIAGGDGEFVNVFPKFIDTESVYGLGDFQFYLALKQLSSGRQPLLIAKNGGNGGALDSNQIRHSSFAITEQGTAVLTGNADFIDLNGIDQWLGGVHISSAGNLWRWDDATETILNS